MNANTLMMATLMMGMATFVYYASADGVFGSGEKDMADMLYPVQDPDDPFGQRARR